MKCVHNHIFRGIGRKLQTCSSFQCLFLTDSVVRRGGDNTEQDKRRQRNSVQLCHSRNIQHGYRNGVLSSTKSVFPPENNKGGGGGRGSHCECFDV